MARRTLAPTALLVAATAAAVVVGPPERVLADDVKVTSSDATARSLALGISKSVVIELETDIKQVLVADPSIVKAVVLSNRRVSIIAAAIGQTNIYFLGADGRQIGGLNIAVLLFAPEPGEFPPNAVTVFRGSIPDQDNNPLGRFVTYNCGPYPHQCVDPRPPGAGQPPGTQNINITGNSGAGTVSVGASSR